MAEAKIEGWIASERVLYNQIPIDLTKNANGSWSWQSQGRMAHGTEPSRALAIDAAINFLDTFAEIEKQVQVRLETGAVASELPQDPNTSLEDMSTAVAIAVAAKALSPRVVAALEEAIIAFGIDPTDAEEIKRRCHEISTGFSAEGFTKKYFIDNRPVLEVKASGDVITIKDLR